MTIASGTTPFRDEPVGQFLPKYPLSKYDCVPAAAACCIGRAAVGRLRRNGRQVRGSSPTAAGETRGMSYGEVVDAAHNATTRTIKPEARFGISNADMKALADSGRSGCISIDCRVTVHTKRATNSFAGDHTVGWYDYRWSTTRDDCRCEKDTGTDHGEILVEDPGTTSAGYLWWSTELLFKAAQARTGGRGINVVVFPDTEGVSWRATAAAQVRTEPSYSKGKLLQRLVPGKTCTGGRTENGGRWKREDGTYATAWVHIKTGAGWGWAKGRALSHV